MQKVMKKKVLDIDKTWHAIHFLLARNAGGCVEGDSLSKVVLGGITSK